MNAAGGPRGSTPSSPPLPIEPWDDLIEAARQAAETAYAPYSRFRVGAAVLSEKGIAVGCNVENASYGLTICAERNAVAAALAAGTRSLRALALHTETDGPTPPCGACRQVLAEFNPALPVLLCWRGGGLQALNLADLLPRPFVQAGRRGSKTAGAVKGRPRRGPTPRRTRRA